MARAVACRIAAAAIWLASLAQAATLTRYPYLQNLRSDRVTILWATLEPGAGAVEYYSTDRSFSRSVPARMQTYTPAETGLSFTYYRYQAVLTGLTGSTEYLYRVIVDGQDLTPTDELRFRTRAFSPFQFLVFGDSGIGSAEQSRIAQRMMEERPALVLHTGDIAYPSGSFESYQVRYFDYYRHLMKRAAFFPSPGNHDYQTDNAASYLTVHDLPTEDVPEPDQERYYSYDWGNVHFIALDSNVPLTRAASGLGAMLAWLENDLRQTRQFWRVAYFHHPPYAGGPNERDPLSALARRYLVPILERYDVPLVLNGHEHSYQRTVPLRGGSLSELGGTVYITTGGGGVGLYPVFPRLFLAYAESAHHYVRADVNIYQMNLRAIRIDGQEMDTVTLSPPPVLLPDSVVNGASFTPAVAAGGLISIFGRQLAAGEIAAARAPLPTTLSSLQVTLNDQRLPLFYVSATQINAQLPFDVVGEATLRVTTPNGSAESTVTISELAPVLFPVSAVHADGVPVNAEAPARPGEIISLYLTGLGSVDGEIAAGQPVPAAALLRVRAPVQVHLAGRSLTPAFAGLAPGFVGLYQVNVQVPIDLADGKYSLRVMAQGVPSNWVEIPVGSISSAILQ